MSEHRGEVACVGVDLAWGERNPSGLALLHLDPGSGRVAFREADCQRTDEDILEWIQARRQATTILAIDAPIIAPNPAGTGRACDKQITSAFGRYHAGTYPANQPKCARPIAFSRKLRRLGFEPDPRKAPGRRGLWQIEVYPHPAQVTLFGLQRILKYKKGKPGARRRGLRKLAEKIGSELPRLAGTAALRALCMPNGVLRGRALKAWEDRLDALFCGYVAAYYWWWGEERCRVFGDVRRGYIVTPWQKEAKEA